MTSATQATWATKPIHSQKRESGADRIRVVAIVVVHVAIGVHVAPVVRVVEIRRTKPPIGKNTIYS